MCTNYINFRFNIVNINGHYCFLVDLENISIYNNFEKEITNYLYNEALTEEYENYKIQNQIYVLRQSPRTINVLSSDENSKAYQKLMENTRFEIEWQNRTIDV